MSGYVQEHIDALEHAKSAATGIVNEMIAELNSGTAKIIDALEGVDSQIVDRINDVVTNATAGLTQAINSTLEGVTMAIDSEITAAEGILEQV